MQSECLGTPRDGKLMSTNKSYTELIAENKELKEKLGRIQAKEKCGRCNGSGEMWDYFDGDIHCPVCSGTGLV